MKSEILNHKDFWEIKKYILNETQEEYSERVDYILNFSVRPEIQEHKDYWDINSKILNETDHEYQGRIYLIKSISDYGVDEKSQDGYYADEENIKKDMLGSQLPFDKAWYREYIHRTSGQ